MFFCNLGDIKYCYEPAGTEMLKPHAANSRLRSILRSLRHRNFRLFFGGQSISLIGTWMQRIALGWLVYRLTNSAFLLGLVGFTSQIPVFILGPFAGVFADRWNRHRAIILTQILAMLQAFILSALVLGDIVRIWQIIILSLALGIINAFDMPIRQSFMVEMIEEKQDLGNAIALNSSMVNGARLLGPSAAGILIVLVGEGICFLLNALSYLAVILSLFLMKIVPKSPNPRNSKIWQELVTGFRYAAGFEPIRNILLMMAVISIMGMPYTILMPIFAKDILHGGPDALGFLMGSTGIGALAGALYLASKRSVLGLGRMIPLAATTFGFGLIIFSFSHVYLLSLIILLFIGVGQMIQMAASNTLLQTIVEDDKRGRIMSFYAMSFAGLTPVGSLLAGTLAGQIGAPWTVCLGGITCIAGAALFFRKLPSMREKIRPIYQHLGIISVKNQNL
jgi:MFS family permease